jgi:hypothetical protein
MLYDVNNNPITHISFSMRPGDVTDLIFQIDCEAGKEFHCDVVGDLVVEAKHYLSGTWINIETSTIDLETWVGTRQTFNCRITAGEVGEITRRQFNLRID